MNLWCLHTLWHPLLLNAQRLYITEVEIEKVSSRASLQKSGLLFCLLVFLFFVLIISLSTSRTQKSG